MDRSPTDATESSQVRQAARAHDNSKRPATRSRAMPRLFYVAGQLHAIFWIQNVHHQRIPLASRRENIRRSLQILELELSDQWISRIDGLVEPMD